MPSGCAGKTPGNHLSLSVPGSEKQSFSPEIVLLNTLVLLLKILF
jgi:hypothetical protein